MKKLFSISIVFLLSPIILLSQISKISGSVKGENVNGVVESLVGATLYWMDNSDGTVTDAQGVFEMAYSSGKSGLVISSYGFHNDTITTGFEMPLEILLISTGNLDQVEVVYERGSTETSFINPMLVQNINEKELQKAACCSLSESFDTSPTIDVSFTDAVTGTRQIQMLGLAGPNIQITREAMPAVRGFNAIVGMEMIPGTWIESIHVNKGTGSVVHGFESIAGQINVELRKPEDTDKLYLNLYGNQGGRMEANVHMSKRLNSNWSSAVLLHGRTNNQKFDRNDDGFLDMTIGNNIIGLNRWKYAGENGLRFQFGVKASYIDRQGGEIDFDPDNIEDPINSWGMMNTINRVEVWSKIGKVFEDIPWKSIGLQLSGSLHDQQSTFGATQYNAGQNSAYANGIYQSILSNTNHKFSTGMSLYYDEYTENLGDRIFDRTEVVPGAFFEYTFKKLEKFNLVAGIRGDHHNFYGAFVTPRLHMRYALAEKSVLRAFAGRGQRTANIISENTGILASDRDVVIYSDDTENPYGLNPEVAWNSGLSYSNGFELLGRKATIIVDFYKTIFENQIVLDLDADVHQAQFYNLDGESYSNSISTQLDYELFKNFDIRMAYRWYDVKTTYHGELLDKIFVSKNRAFINLAYKTNNDWKADLTVNWQDKKRIPNTSTNPVEDQRPETSPDFVNVNAQISKKWKNNLEVYLGMENILDYRQDDPIISSSNPFGENFDASLVWGPIFGRNTYAGLRYRLK
ncbi:MAG: outer membrane receptor for ferrienterochelin and colicins [Patiriisocius sp.]|jgi:outer membrane receptor for ferrienterochelin and colicins